MSDVGMLEDEETLSRFMSQMVWKCGWATIGYECWACGYSWVVVRPVGPDFPDACPECQVTVGPPYLQAGDGLWIFSDPLPLDVGMRGLVRVEPPVTWIKEN